jgi:hypothetical protein
MKGSSWEMRIWALKFKVARTRAPIALDATTQAIEFPGDQGVACTQYFQSRLQTRAKGP